MCIEEVSLLSSGKGLDLIEEARRVRRTVVPAASCGNCGCKHGEYQQGDDVVVFSRKGAEDATTFNFKCSECNAVSGPTTTVLNTGPGEEPFHVVSKNMAVRMCLSNSESHTNDVTNARVLPATYSKNSPKMA